MKQLGVERKVYKKSDTGKVVSNIFSTMKNQVTSTLNFKDILGMENEKQVKKVKKIATLFEGDADINKEEAFKKSESLKKILSKFSNKTFTIKMDEDQYEVPIKIKVCELFEYIFDLKEDFVIFNIVEYFKNSFLEKTYKLQDEDVQNLDLNDVIKGLLPENNSSAGGDLENESKFKNYTDFEHIRSFDSILEKPFIEVLLFSFFFTSAAPLQNSLLGLIRRVCT